MRRLLPTLLLISGAAAMACGGNVNISSEAGTTAGSGTGGGGTSGSLGAGAGSTAASSTATGSGGCDALRAQFVNDFAAAVACNACMNFDGCMNGPTIHDTCGCEVAANSQHAAEATAAEQDFKAWVAAGCGPEECLFCPSGTGWACAADPTACGGRCTAF